MRARLATISLILVAMAACTHAPPSSVPGAPTPVEVWRGGDDGLTLRLADTLENAFRRTSDFALGTGEKPGTLIVTIPSNVTWIKIGSRTEVDCYVTFSGVSSQVLGGSRGRCWEDDLETCADRVVRDARSVRARM